MKCGYVKFTTFSDIAQSKSGKRGVHLLKNIRVLAVYLQPCIIYFWSRGGVLGAVEKGENVPGSNARAKMEPWRFEPLGHTSYKNSVGLTNISYSSILEVATYTLVSQNQRTTG